MKKIIFVITIMAGLGFSGCQKKLDIPNPNAPTIENFWLNGNDALLGVNATYSVLHRGAISRYLPMFLLGRADEGYSTSPFFELANALDKFILTDYNWFFTADVYQDHYQGIYRANQVLANVPGINMDESLKQRLLGEAKFLRGLFYFQLAILYGNVPSMLQPSKAGDLPPQASQAEVFAQVATDLTEAAAVLPATYPSAELGRATKGAAYALLAKVYMQQKMWNEALTPLQWLVEGEGKTIYDLRPNYRDNFLVTTENNNESIFEWQFEINTTETHDDDLQDPNQNYGTSLAQFVAPKPVGFQDIEARRWIINEFYQEKTVAGERDPRLEASFLFDSTDIRGPEFTMIYGVSFVERYADREKNPDGSDGPVIRDANGQAVIDPALRSKAYFRKFLNDHWKNDEGFRSRNNWRYIRYADVLLMYAEVLNELGRTADAYPHVDRVRQRAGLATLTTARPGLSQDAFRSQIEHERLTELAGEGWRWHDLVRFGYLNTNAPAKLVAHDPSFANFQAPRDLFLPIPQRDMDINPNLEQNTGF
jgi:hypothetical protein